MKTTGFAALSIAAAGVLGGCELSPLPGTATLTDFCDAQSIVAKEMTYDISVTPLSDEWTSYAATFESDGKIHHYLYIGLSISRPTHDFSVRTSNFTCNAGKIYGFGNIALSDSSKYTIPTELKITAGDTKTVPLYIDLGDKTKSSLSDLEIRLTAYNKAVTIRYNPIGTAPVINF